MGPLEQAGMVLIIFGILLSSVTMFLLKDADSFVRKPRPIIFTPAYLDLLHNSSWTWAHSKLVATLIFSIAIDFMKPATIGFIMPGLLAGCCV